MAIEISDTRAPVALPKGMSLEHMYRMLYRIRRVEEEIERIYPTDKIKSPVHLSIGQEAIAVGVCEALRPSDVVFATYRGHAAYLAKGGDLPRMMAELYGKATGVARGKGGSMHLIDAQHGVMGMSAVVATTIPHAAGYAYRLQLDASDGVVVSFFGDGATEEGVYFETLNWAAVQNLPLLLVCENNGFAIHTPVQARQKEGTSIAAKAAAFGIPTVSLSDDDPFAIARAASDAVAAIRARGGPQFIECRLYRWRGHVGPGSDFDIGFRSMDQALPWMESDQVVRVGQLLDAPVRSRVEREEEAAISAAIAFAEHSPFPTPDKLWADVYAD